MTAIRPPAHPHARSRRVAGLALVVLSAASVADADPLAPCRALAAYARAAAAEPAGVARAQGEAAGLLAPVIRRVPDAPPDPGLQAKAAALFKLDGTVPASLLHLQRLASHVWRAVAMEGTADCAYEVFFLVADDGALSKLPPPARFGDLCWTSRREVARIQGRTALVETEQVEAPRLGQDVEVTPWLGGAGAGGWGPACRVSVRFDDAFRVSERFCGEAAACAAGAPLAARLAEAWARAPDDRARSAALAAYASPARTGVRVIVGGRKAWGAAGLPTALPTFGARPRTRFPDYSADTFAPVTVAGRTLLARVGRGGVGWRRIGDYLVAFYDPAAGLRPVASYVVERRATGLRSAEASIPAPVVERR